MDGKRFITKLRLRNLLSFGPEAEEFELEPLNVLIGPNASGKSNVIEAISLLQAAPDDIQEPIRRGGGIMEWLWKGGEEDCPARMIATVVLDGEETVVNYEIAFAGGSGLFWITDEVIEDQSRLLKNGHPLRYYDRRRDEPVFVSTFDEEHPVERELTTAEFHRDFNTDLSVLSQVQDPFTYSQIWAIGYEFAKIRLYREWHLGRGTEPRKPQLPDLPSDFLSEDANNLALVVNHLQNRPGVEERLNQELRRFYPRAQKITVRILGGTVQLQLHEEGLRDPIPATRMSDGTLRYLCLLSILLHPDPPPLVCIEEPEIGLHPDIIVRLAHLMEEASERMQLIVTTHSDALVAALSGVPEAVVICERDENGSTTMRRLSREDLGEWLDRYTLGDLWMKGELGGVP